MTNPQHILVASYDLKLHIYDMRRYAFVDDIDLCSQANCIVSTPSTSFFLAGYSYIFQYDLNSKGKRPLQTIVAHDSNVNSIALTDVSIISCGDDKYLKVWDRRTYQPSFVLLMNDPINTALPIPLTTSVLICNETGAVAGYDLRNSQCVQKVVIGESPIRDLVLTPDSKQFFAASMDGTAVCYNFLNEGPSISFNENYRVKAHNEYLLRIAVSPNNKYFATAAADNTSKLWSIETGDIIQTFQPTDAREWTWDIKFFPDSSKIAVAGSDGCCRIWDINGHVIHSLPQIEKCISRIALMNM